nr:hypothetical protein [Tanacetum cinerariifolium]
MAILYDHQKHHHMGLTRELVIKGIVTDMEIVADMATGTDMTLTDGVVIDRVVTDMVMVVTDWEMVVRRRGMTKISRFRANIIVVLMGHQARADTRIITHVPHVTFVGNFIQERHVIGLLVLALNVERLGIWLKIVRKEFTMIVPLFPTFKASKGSLISCNNGSPTIPGQVTDLLTISTLCIARSIVVQLALVVVE